MGVFSLVLHTHLPYVRRNGAWPSGEDFFHQAATESYLPMLETLERIAERHTAGPTLTVGLTPLVAHQMQDPYMLRELELYLGRYELRAWWQVANYDGMFAEEFKELAGFYARHARRQLARLGSLGPRGIAGAFGSLAEAGAIELAGGPASHPVLPEIGEPAVLRAQVLQGVAEHERHFGSKPRAMWIPECAYRPGMGIAELLAEAGVTNVVVDGPTMLRSGPDSTFRHHRIGDTGVAAFARNLDVTYRVWSPTGGYPGNKSYRDFFAYDMTAGFKNWRVTSKRTPISGKKPYEPVRGGERAGRDAEDFVTLLDAALSAYEERTGSEGIVVACYDTELFGHWWFEGPAFVEHVYRLLDGHPRVRAMSLGRALEELPPGDPVALREGSWGLGKDLRSWIAPETEDMWRALAEAEAETVRLVRKFAAPDAAQERALAQLVRELFLLQSSDWPFMVLRGNNAGYARERFQGHRDRWGRLADALLRRLPAGPLDALTRELAEIDNPFPRIDYRLASS